MPNKTVKYFLLFISIITACSILYSSEIYGKGEYRVLKVYPHDDNAQTEGLIFLNGYIYEGTGPCRNGPSSIRKVQLKTGHILKYKKLPGRIFGEGITVFNNKLIELTYKSKTGFVYDLDTFRLINKFHYKTEGWGLTNDGNNLIMSDGSSTLHFLDPVTFKEVKKVTVHDNKGDISRINELEYINGKVFANIFLSDIIVIISPDTGKVVGSINLDKVLKGYFSPGLEDPANGIAYDRKNNNLLLTGKYWPYLYRVSIPAK